MPAQSNFSPCPTSRPAGTGNGTTAGPVAGSADTETEDEDPPLSDGEVAVVAAVSTGTVGTCAMVLLVWFFCPKAPFVIRALKKAGLYDKCCSSGDEEGGANGRGAGCECDGGTDPGADGAPSHSTRPLCAVDRQHPHLVPLVPHLSDSRQISTAPPSIQSPRAIPH